MTLLGGRRGRRSGGDLRQLPRWRKDRVFRAGGRHRPSPECSSRQGTRRRREKRAPNVGLATRLWSSYPRSDQLAGCWLFRFGGAGNTAPSGKRKDLAAPAVHPDRVLRPAIEGFTGRAPQSVTSPHFDPRPHGSRGRRRFFIERRRCTRCSSSIRLFPDFGGGRGGARMAQIPYLAGHRIVMIEDSARMKGSGDRSRLRGRGGGGARLERSFHETRIVRSASGGDEGRMGAHPNHLGQTELARSSGRLPPRAGAQSGRKGRFWAVRIFFLTESAVGDPPAGGLHPLPSGRLARWGNRPGGALGGQNPTPANQGVEGKLFVVAGPGPFFPPRWGA